MLNVIHGMHPQFYLVFLFFRSLDHMGCFSLTVLVILCLWPYSWCQSLLKTTLYVCRQFVRMCTLTEHSKILLELIRSETQPRRLFCNTEMEINATFFVQTLLYICCENVYLSRAKYAVLLSYLSRWNTLLKPSNLSSTICSFIFAFNLHVCWIDYWSESVNKQLFKTCNDEAQHYLQLIMLFF